MASNKRKQDEKHLKMLREMVALPSNKTCFDCHQRGPTYVNMTIGSFVCTSCSGILRGLNPPHRVKSISMASFTPEEMDFLKSHGNELNRKVYLGLYDNRTWPEPDSRDEQRVRDFMVQKYENKRFFVAPTEAMREEARRMNDAALSKQPQTKPLRALLGENATKLVVGTSQTNSASQNNISSTQVVSTMATPPRTSVSTPVSQQPVKSTSGGFDLLGDLGSDPFASSAPAIDGANTGDFADFSKIGASMSAAPTQYAQAVTQSPGFPPMPSAPLHPFNSGSLQPQPLSATPAHSAPHTSTPAQNSATSFSAISDKYAALADLDSSFTQSSTTVNWGGSDSAVGSGIRSTAGSSIGSTGGSNINWGGGSSATGSGDGSVNWGNQSGGGSGGLSWNSSGGPASMGGTVFGGTASTNPWHLNTSLSQPGNPFTTHTGAANPFGASSTPAMSQGGGIPSHANPFGTSAHPPTFAAPSTVAAGFGHSPASSAAGFGYQQQQFPVQNGGFSMATTSGGFTPFGGTHPSTAPPSYGVAQQQAFQAQHNMVPQGFSMQQPVPQGYAAGWGQMGTQPSSANPFMSAVNQRQMPPRGTSTNPFL